MKSLFFFAFRAQSLLPKGHRSMHRACLFAVLFLSATAHGASVSFHQLVLGADGQNGIFSVDLDGDGRRDLIGLSGGRISVYRADPKEATGYAPRPEELLTGPHAYYADAADVLPAKGKEILVLTPTGIFAYFQEGGRFALIPQPLVRCSTILSMVGVRGGLAAAQTEMVAVLPWNFAFDANGDGLDDLLVPHDGGVDVHLQTAPGQFAKPITLSVFPFAYHMPPEGYGPGEFAGFTARGIRIQVIFRDIERRDVNGDGKPDLVCGACWFAQKLDGSFDPRPAVVPGWAAPTNRDRGLRTLDLNGDGRQDSLHESLIPEDPLNLRTRVRIFLTGNDGQPPPTPSQVVVDQNILIHTQLPVHDFNGDGALDFAMFKTDITPTMVAKWIRQCFGKIDGYLNFYLFNKAANCYGSRPDRPAAPAFSKRIRMNFKVDLMEAMMGLVWERYLATMMRFEGDYNADGRPDLLVRDETNHISIYLNTGDPVRLYPEEPDIALEGVPAFGGLALDDLNGDGATDLILYLGNYDHVIAAYVSRRR